MDAAVTDASVLLRYCLNSAQDTPDPVALENALLKDLQLCILNTVTDVSDENGQRGELAQTNSERKGHSPFPSQDNSNLNINGATGMTPIPQISNQYSTVGKKTSE